MRLLFILLLLITSTSCTKFVLKKYGAIGGKPVIKKIITKNKDVLFLGMIHIAQRSFYDRSQKVIDSLSDSGYYIFGEDYGDSLTYRDTTLLKKVRKIVNTQISKSSILRVKKMMEKYELKIQPKDLYFLKDTTKSIIVDNTLIQQIQAYEKIKGEIKLDSCDINTKIGEEYECEKLDRNERTFFRNEIIIKLRNNLVIDAVKKSNKKKILIIYGENHFNGIKKGLEN